MVHYLQLNINEFGQSKKVTNKFTGFGTERSSDFNKKDDTGAIECITVQQNFLVQSKGLLYVQ